MVLWGRLFQPQDSFDPETTPHFTSQKQSLRLLQLTEKDRTALLTLFWEGIRKPDSSETDDREDSDDLPETLRTKYDATVAATIYAPGRRQIRRRTRKSTLADSIRHLAQAIRESDAYTDQGYSGDTNPRVRIDILTHSSPLSSIHRHQLNNLPLSAPLGTAVRHDQKTALCLPGDFASNSSLSYADCLQSPLLQLDIQSEKWEDAGVKMSLLRTSSFISTRDEPDDSLKLYRGLPVRQHLTASNTEHSANTLARFIGKMQNRRGLYEDFHNAINSLSAPNESTISQARTTGTLLKHVDRSSSQNDSNLLAVCRQSLTTLLERVKAIPDKTSMAFAVAKEDSDKPSLLATAWTLHAFSVYTHTTSDPSWEDLILRLSRFLLLSQNEKGIFVPPVENDNDDANEEEQQRRQYACVTALAASYQVSEDRDFLLSSREGLEQMHSHMKKTQVISPEHSSAFINGVLDLSPHLPVSRYMPSVRKAVKQTLNSQITNFHALTPDLVGGSLFDYPPSSYVTANTLNTLAAANILLDKSSSQSTSFFSKRIREAARKACQFLIQFQFTGANSYYVLSPTQTLGGIRRRPGSNLATIKTAEAALRALNVFRHSDALNETESDTKSKN
ncbi:MAG: hypothetical protein ACOC0A_00875 [Planctomycetota bacterium]